LPLECEGVALAPPHQHVTYSPLVLAASASLSFSIDSDETEARMLGTWELSACADDAPIAKHVVTRTSFNFIIKSFF
jgi:hypothetical protein